MHALRAFVLLVAAGLALVLVWTMSSYDRPPAPVERPASTVAAPTSSAGGGLSWARCMGPESGASWPYASGDGFRCLADHVFDERTNMQLAPPLPPTVRGRPLVVFVKTDALAQWAASGHAALAPHIGEHGYVLLVHNSDDAAPPHLLRPMLSAAGSPLRHVWAQNVLPAFRDPRVSPLPIGLENRRWGRQLPNVYAACNARPWSERTIPVLLNFNANTDERRSAVQHLAPRSFVVSSTSKKQTQAEFVRDLGNAKFVISPRGNGADCHRTWEAFVCGCAVVQLVDTLRNDTFAGMPLVHVAQWADITSAAVLEERVRPFVDRATGRLNVAAPRHTLRFHIDAINDKLRRPIKRS